VGCSDPQFKGQENLTPAALRRVAERNPLPRKSAGRIGDVSSRLAKMPRPILARIAGTHCIIALSQKASRLPRLPHVHAMGFVDVPTHRAQNTEDSQG